MVDTWFGGEASFVALLNRGLDAVESWARQGGSGLSNADFGWIDAIADGKAVAADAVTDSGVVSNATPPEALDKLFDTLLTAWQAAPSETAGATAATAGPTAAPAGYTPVFSTFVDGANKELVRDIAYDSSGNIYITGGTENFRNLPITPGNDYYVKNGVDSSGRFPPHDVFIQKYDPSGNLLWSTRLGGKNYDRAYAIEVDDGGSVYIAGRAGEDFYVTPGVLQEQFGGNTHATTNRPYGKQDSFVAKLDADSGQLDWSTYFGGNAGELIRDIDVGPDGVIHIAQTFVNTETNQHITKDALQPSLRGASDSVYAQLSNDGSTLLYGTFIGGPNDTIKSGEQPSIVVDANGDINMVMSTSSPGVYTTSGAVQSSLRGDTDYYLVKFDGADGGRSIKSATYFGTEEGDITETHQLAVDDQGNFIVAGETFGSSLTGPGGGFRDSPSGGPTDGFIGVVSADGTQVLASTFFGGSGRDNIEGIAYTDQGIFVTGFTTSPDLQVTDHTTFGGYNGGEDAFFAQFSHDLSTLLYATYIGGSRDEQGRALAVSDTGKVTIGGITNSRDFFTYNAEDGSISGNGAGFLTQIAPTASPPTTPPSPPTPPTLPPSPPPAGGHDEIVITAAARLYQGGAEADVKVDGVVVDTITVDADQRRGETEVLHVDTGMTLTGSEVIEVEYTNDIASKAGGRNLFIHGVEVNGQTLLLADADLTAKSSWYSPSANMIFLGTNGSAVFDATFPATPAPPPPAPLPPPTLPPAGGGHDEIVITAGARLYQGGAEADVKVDGVVVDTITINADHRKGETEVLHVDTGMALTGSEVIEVEYTNDIASKAGGRNLFIHGVEVNGQTLLLADADLTTKSSWYSPSADMIFLGTNGSAVFQPVSSAALTTITLVAAADADQGDAEADILANGGTVGTIQTSADQQLDQSLPFGLAYNGPADSFDTITVASTSDWAVPGAGDRNLFLDDALIHGVEPGEPLTEVNPATDGYYGTANAMEITETGNAHLDISLQADLLGL